MRTNSNYNFIKKVLMHLEKYWRCSWGWKWKAAMCTFFVKHWFPPPTFYHENFQTYTKLKEFYSEYLYHLDATINI